VPIPEISNNLCDCDSVCIKTELVLEECRVQVLTAMRHEVESSHEKDEVDQEKPVVLERDFAFLDKRLADAGASFADSLTFDESVGLREEHSVHNDQKRWAGT
jgi:hypothetical protein